MKIEIEAPNERQLEFFKARTRYVAYGGARGGGKSWAVRRKAFLLACRYPGIRILILRRTYAELRENHILPMTREVGAAAIYRDSDKAFIFQNSSRIRFGYCDGDADILQYQGQEFDVIFIDEATQFSEYQFVTLSASLRGANDFPKRMYLTCNPGGIGHEWVKRLFIDRRYRGSENEAEYTFIPARVYDNHALLARDKGYVKALENLPPDLRRAWLEGDWNVFAGQYFDEFRTDRHVCAPFEIPRHWRRYATLDYGLDMLAFYQVAVDERGRAYVYSELYKSGLIISEACRMIRECADAQVFLAPPDLWNRRQETGRSASDIFYENGITLTKTSNDRVFGWMCLKERLADMGDGEPGLKIFSTCRELIRTLPLVQHDRERVNDVASQPHELTHAPDALRGFCVYRAQSGVPAKPRKIYNFAFERPKKDATGKGERMRIV